MRKGIVTAIVTVTSATLALTGFLLTRDSEEEAFRKSAEGTAFCREAAPLDLRKTEELTPHKRQHVIEDLGERAPEGVAPDFERLSAWYEHAEPEHEEAARKSSYAVGEFIERVCPDINIGGIRS
ncbi:hypothetical protein GCM10010275_22940 [Streptomyces litmocidini]|uniref:hypothetical protein n=1 Tax=Streptomyces litmocidini TaxID=67318 RepID=UPI00167F02A0|nr:hypothetical protein [Streptomyces litmocidini]GGU86631.1 hypothetical protein GCM10010275_22940 [Streptomyces litmocidini]